MEIETIVQILVVFIFVGGLAAFSYQSINRAGETGVNSFQIQDAEDLAQLQIYVASISYQCTGDDGGMNTGYTIIGDKHWTWWEDYRSGLSGTWDDFEDIAPKNLGCAGSDKHLPLADGLRGILPGAMQGTGNWINDQPGKYSRQDFVIKEDISETYKCVGHGDQDQNSDNNEFREFHMGVVDNETANIAVYNYDGSGDPTTGWKSGSGNWVGNCYDLHDPGNPVEPVNGPSFVLNVLTPSNVDLNQVDQADFVRPDEARTSNPPNSPVTMRSYELCEGTKGYVQSNAGSNDDMASSYDIESPPGDPELNVGHERPTNTIHPYMVITEYTCN